VRYFLLSLKWITFWGEGHVYKNYLDIFSAALIRVYEQGSGFLVHFFLHLYHYEKIFDTVIEARVVTEQ
jgi:hypothetical protein